MYDRYTIGRTGKELADQLKLTLEEPFEVNFNAQPTQKLPVITAKNPGVIELFHWGLVTELSNNKPISPRLFNISLDTIQNKPMYRKALSENRCCILADGFYAWKQISKKQKVPYFFYFKDRKPFMIAGIWEEYEDMEGLVSRTFNMLVLNSTAPIDTFQSDCPAILNEDTARKWLDESTVETEFDSLLDNSKLKELNYHPVSPLITTLKNNDQSLIEPTQPSDQHGNYTLF